MLFLNKYLVLILLIVFCILNYNECKPDRKKSNSTQRSSTGAKLVKSKKIVQSSRDKEIQSAMQTLRNHKVIEPNAKLTGKKGKQQLVLSPKKKVNKSLNDVMKNSKLLSSTSKPVVKFANGMNIFDQLLLYLF